MQYPSLDHYIRGGSTLVFNSFAFIVFFPIVVILYLIVPTRLRSLWLLIASYYFYMSWEPAYGILIAVITAITYAGGRLIGSSKDSSNQRIACVYLTLTVLFCIGTLCFCRYPNFVIRHLNIPLSIVGIPAISELSIVLSVGVSFYTLQALGYVIDVYRGKTTAERNPVNYALYVSFFPTLISGPIERSTNLLPQIKRITEIKVRDYDRIVNGLITMLYGLFLKMVIADRLSILVNNVYSKYMMYQSTELVAGSLAYTLQIYCDFAGYSLTAIGAAQVLGLNLKENFNTPYLATSIKDFWRRWHISLSSWLRDYVYISLGGNRCSKFRRYVNIMITFLVSGLWHGNGLTYIVWGGLHGLYQVVGDLLSSVRGRIFRNVKKDCFSYRFGQIAITFSLVNFAWIFFRADSLGVAIVYIERMFTRINPWALFDGTLYELGLDVTEIHIVIFGLIIMVLVDLLRYRKGQQFSDFLMSQNLYFRWFVSITLIVMILVYGEYGAAYDAQSFIYMQF